MGGELKNSINELVDMKTELQKMYEDGLANKGSGNKNPAARDQGTKSETSKGSRSSND